MDDLVFHISISLHLTDSPDISGFGSLRTSSTIRTQATQLLESKDATATKTTELLLSDNLAQLFNSDKGELVTKG
jgi:hypothetical protein